MQYSHKKKSALYKFTYLTSICLGFVCAFINVTGILASVFSVLSIALIMGGMFIFMKYDATTYTVVVNAKETDFDFFISKAVGKRGAYICYFLISDALEIVKYKSSTTKDELKYQYKGLLIHNYVHNFNSKDRYAIIFKLDDKLDALVVELNEDALKQLEHFMSVATAVNERHKETLGYGDDDDDEISEQPSKAITDSCEPSPEEITIIDATADSENE